jgi:hypothetical protein
VEKGDYEAYYEPQKMHISELLGRSTPVPGEYQDFDGYKALRSFTARALTPSCKKWWPRVL